VARLDRITNLPTEPGDTVRDKKTKTDYIVQSIVPYVVGGASLYYLLNAYTGKLEQVIANDLKDRDFQPTRKNVERMTPEQVRESRLDTLVRGMKGNEDLLRKLETPEGSVFRDLLLLIDDMDDSQVKEKFRKFGETLVSVTDRVYNSTEILELMQQSLGDSASFYGHEYLSDLAEELSEYTSARTGTNKLSTYAVPRFNATRDIAGFEKVNGKQGFVDRALQYSLSKSERSLSSRKEFVNTVRQTVFNREGFSSPAIRRSAGMNELFDNITDPYSRVAKMVAASLGGKATEETRIVRNITNKILNGDEALTAALIDSDINGIFSNLYRQTTFRTRAGLANKLSARRTSSAARRARPTKRLNVSSLLKGMDRVGDTEKYISISKSSLINDVIGSKSVSVNSSKGIVGTLRQDAVRKKMESLPEVITMPASVLRKQVDSNIVSIEEIELAHNQTPQQISRELRGKMGGRGAAVGYAGAFNHNAKAAFFEVNDKKFDTLEKARTNLLPDQSIYSIKAFNKMGNEIPLFPQVIKVETDMDLVNESYHQAKDESRLAYYTIQNSSGEKSVNLIGSSMNVSIDDQIDRAFAAANTRGRSSLSLDIENNPETGAITEIGVSFRDTEGGYKPHFNFVAGNGESESNAILRLVGRLENADYVGTMTAHDFSTLASRAMALSKTSQSPTMQKNLEAAYYKLLEIEQKAGYDFTVGLTAAGQFGDTPLTLGNISQDYLSPKILGRAETHTAMQDSMDALEIQDKIRVGELQASKAELGTIFQVRSTRVNRDGSFGRLTGFERRGEGSSALFEEMVFNEGRFTTTGSLFELQADGTSQLGAAMRGLIPVGHGEAVAPNVDINEMVQFTSRRMEERGSRIIRGINPLNTSYYDATTRFGIEGGNLFGLHELSVVQQTRSLLGSEKAQEILKNVGSMQFDQIEEAARDLASTVQLGDDASKPGYQARLVESVTNAFTDAQYRQSLTKSSLTDLLDSAAGKSLVGMAEKGIDGNFIEQYAAPALSLSFMGEVAGIQAPTSFVSDPRLRLQTFDRSGPFQGAVTNVLGYNTTEREVENSVKSLIGQTMLATTSSKAPGAGAFIENAIGPEGLNKVIESVSLLRQSKEIKDDIHALDALSTTLYSDPSIKRLADAIDESDFFHGNIKEQLLRRNDLLREHKDALGVHDVDIITERFKNIVEEEFAKTSSASSATAASIKRAQNQLGDAAHTLFSDVTPDSLDFNAISKLGSEKVDELTNDALRRIHEMTTQGTGGSDVLQHIFDKTGELRNVYFKSGLSPRDQAIALNAFVKESEEVVKLGSQTTNPIELVHSVFLKYQNAAQTAKASAPTLTEMQSTIVNQATSLAANASEDISLKEVQHTVLLGNKIASEMELKKVTVPLLAVGGLLALIAGSSRPKEEYSGGYASKQSPGVIAAHSEIPGTGSGTRVFMGQEAPFQTTVNMTSYVQSEREKQAIQTKVYDMITGTARPVQVRVDNKDFRKNDHRETAMEQLRQAL